MLKLKDITSNKKKSILILISKFLSLAKLTF